MDVNTFNKRIIGNRECFLFHSITNKKIYVQKFQHFATAENDSQAHYVIFQEVHNSVTFQ